MTTTLEAVRGTVKVGRWTYPAIRKEDGTVVRNSKRDGSGDWDETNPALFMFVGEGDPIAEKAAQAVEVPEIPGFVDAPAPAPERKSSGHGGRVGAQVRKPGKSSWKIGDTCPQGHELTEETLYEMPSGRKQCRVCRGSYRSNAGE